MLHSVVKVIVVVVKTFHFSVFRAREAAVLNPEQFLTVTECHIRQCRSYLGTWLASSFRSSDGSWNLTTLTQWLWNVPSFLWQREGTLQVCTCYCYCSTEMSFTTANSRKWLLCIADKVTNVNINVLVRNKCQTRCVKCCVKSKLNFF